VRRVLRAFGVSASNPLAGESCGDWPREKHLLFWDLLQYDGSEWSAVHGLPGMIGETKRLIAECHRG